MSENTVKCEECGKEYLDTLESYNTNLFRCWVCGRVLCLQHTDDEGAICEQCDKQEK